MILDAETNFVYLADSLPRRFPGFSAQLVAAFEANRVPFGWLPGTRDVWAMDYMPVQVRENHFVQFVYQPDYLMDTAKWRKTITDVDAVCGALGILPVKSTLVLDGGNLSRWKDRAILTIKVFQENHAWPEMSLIQALQDLLEIQHLIFVPTDAGDWLGHADGMARFLSENRVLVNAGQTPPEAGQVNFRMALHNARLSWESFPCPSPAPDAHPHDATGLYLNYLELASAIVLPIFGLEEDQEAIQRAREIWPDKSIIPVPAREPARENGIINCLTWNIKR